jgi:hypothetical protein
MLQRQRDLPDYCYIAMPGNARGNRIGMLMRDERGYFPTLLDSELASDTAVEDTVARMNERLGVRPSQVIAMRIGAEFGWEVAGADPANYAVLDGARAKTKP